MTSLFALAVTSFAWGAPADGVDAPSAPAAKVAYVPGVDAALDAAVLRGLRAALAAADPEGTRVVLEIGRRPRAWSNAAPEAVRLVFERDARVLVAPPDRRVAHLMAQVATRVQVPVVSTSEARTVGATGSRWVSVATDGRDRERDWEAIGRRAGRLALEFLADTDR